MNQHVPVEHLPGITPCIGICVGVFAEKQYVTAVFTFFEAGHEVELVDVG